MNRRTNTGKDRLMCPHCGECGFRVVDSRPNPERTRILRRLECRSCIKRYSTIEQIVAVKVREAPASEPFEFKAGHLPPRRYVHNR